MPLDRLPAPNDRLEFGPGFFNLRARRRDLAKPKEPRCFKPREAQVDLAELPRRSGEGERLRESARTPFERDEFADAAVSHRDRPRMAKPSRALPGGERGQEWLKRIGET